MCKYLKDSIHDYITLTCLLTHYITYICTYLLYSNLQEKEHKQLVACTWIRILSQEITNGISWEVAYLTQFSTSKLHRDKMWMGPLQLQLYGLCFPIWLNLNRYRSTVQRTWSDELGFHTGCFQSFYMGYRKHTGSIVQLDYSQGYRLVMEHTGGLLLVGVN